MGDERAELGRQGFQGESAQGRSVEEARRSRVRLGDLSFEVERDQSVLHRIEELPSETVRALDLSAFLSTSRGIGRKRPTQ